MVTEDQRLVSKHAHTQTETVTLGLQ